MNEFLKMDVFFFVATIGLLVLVVFASFVLWRFQKILKHVEHISEQVSKESDALRDDFAVLRSDIRHGKNRLWHLFDFFIRTKKRRTQK